MVLAMRLRSSVVKMCSSVPSHLASLMSSSESHPRSGQDSAAHDRDPDRRSGIPRPAARNANARRSAGIQHASASRTGAIGAGVRSAPRAGRLRRAPTLTRNVPPFRAQRVTRSVPAPGMKTSGDSLLVLDGRYCSAARNRRPRMMYVHVWHGVHVAGPGCEPGTMRWSTYAGSPICCADWRVCSTTSRSK
jgi:hypothetical protein